MALKRCLTVIVLAASLSAGVLVPAAAGESLTVQSNPSGALVELKGEATVSGITPTTFRYPLTGDYNLTVRLHGYEDYRTRVTLDPTKQITLSVDLKRKTRLKAAVRSMFFPGWGQKYAGQKTKSFLFVLLGAGAAASYLIADHNFDIKFDRFEQKADAYDLAVATGASYAELQKRLNELEIAQEEAYDSENARRITIGAIVAVWAINVLDALIFTPEERGLLKVQGLTIAPARDEGTLGLVIQKGF